MPILSVVLTTFRDLNLFLEINKNLHESLSTLSEIELIIVDDSRSFQESWNRLNAVASIAGLNFSAFCTTDNLRQGGARNLALKVARGDYIWFIDSDDRPHFQSALSAVSSANVDIIVNNFSYENTDFTSSHGSYSAYERNITERLKINGSLSLGQSDILFFMSMNSISTACWPYFYRRQFLLDNNIIFQECIYFEDLIFNIKCFSRDLLTTHYTGIAVYNHIKRENSSSTTKSLERKIMRLKQSLFAAILCLKSNSRFKIISAFFFVLYHGIWASK
jgi:glycosyltransferase involved in cell wall biosynthesis